MFEQNEKQYESSFNLVMIRVLIVNDKLKISLDLEWIVCGDYLLDTLNNHNNVVR